jgi:uncharacterized protein (TIGR02246 family)
VSRLVVMPVVCGLIAVFGLAERVPGWCYLDPGGEAVFATHAEGAVAASLGHASQATDRSSDEAQVRDAVRRYDAAVLAMDADTIAAFYLPDGEMWDAGKLARKGPGAIRTFLKSFDGQVRVESQKTTIDKLGWQGARAIVDTTYRQAARLLETNTLIDAHGRIRFTWVRDEAGRWRIARAETTPE